MQSHTDFYASTPKKLTASGVIFRNSKGEILIERPSYKPYWLLPGGVIEKNELPENGAVREVKEELSLVVDRDKLKLVAIVYTDTVTVEGDKFDVVHFVFDGGIMDEGEIKKIKVDNDEILEAKFIADADLEKYFTKDDHVRRVRSALLGIKEGRIVYLNQRLK